jgi:N-acetyl-alpha-D-glucosaminyl L-malate synthase BshA
MRIGISCHATVGGSGAIAAALGKLLADEGHDIHFVCHDVPFGLSDHHHPGITVHKVEAKRYPPLKWPPYEMALAVKMVSVSRLAKLDLFHVHYAIPYALSAYLAREMLAPEPLKLVCTLHGTDITLVGVDPLYQPLVEVLLNACDSVTTVSNWLGETAENLFELEREVHTIYNFVDTEEYRRIEGTSDGVPTVVHVSNFRPVKRTIDVIEIFKRVRNRMTARLVMVGDGPDRAAAAARADELGIGADVSFLGMTQNVVDIMSAADVFLLPSETESFGLAALEAMACEVPVVAADVGGLGEVVEDGESGYLLPLGDLESMAGRTIEILENPELRARMGAKGRAVAVEKFSPQTALNAYMDIYHSMLQ